MIEEVLDTFSALDSANNPLTTITHPQRFYINDTVVHVQVQTVADSFEANDSAVEDSAHYVSEPLRITSTVTSVRTTVSSVSERFSALSAAAGGVQHAHTDTETFSASDTLTAVLSQTVTDQVWVNDAVTQTALSVAQLTDRMSITSSVIEAGMAGVKDVFSALSRATDAVSSIQYVTDTFATNDAAGDTPRLLESVADTFDAADSATGTAEIVAQFSDPFHIYSRVRSPVSTSATVTGGWIANALGMAMTRTTGRQPAHRAGQYAGGATGLHHLGTRPGSVDTGSTKLSKSAERVRISNVYCDGELSNATLALTSEIDARTSATYTYTYRGRAGLSNGRFDTGKGLTCQRMRMVLAADVIQMNRLQIVGGTSNRRL
jgi:hypothetical protein